MDNVKQMLSGYIPGSLQIIELSDTRFRLEGNWCVSNQGTDHQQLIYEALEIAANSSDKFKGQFKAMLDEYMALTADWVE